MSDIQNISTQERVFCQLYVNGCAPYAGNAAKCYKEAFRVSSDDLFVRHKALELMKREDIASYLKELEELSIEDANSMKKFLTENLKHIIEECSDATFTDRRGNVLSPAALRSVAVSASKALMEMYPVKESQKLEINGGDEGGGITFNVIVPDQKPQTNTPNEPN